jgi:hypothetical protein
MTNDRQLERLLDAWLTEGPTQAPDRVIDDVAARITRQPQRPAWRLHAWRFPTMSTPLKLVLIGAALLAALVAGSILVGGGGGNPVAPPTPWPTTTPTPSPIASLPRIPDGSMEAGTYIGNSIPGNPLTWTVTVPEGWTGGSDEWALYPLRDPGVAIVGPTSGWSVPADSCAAAATVAATSVDTFIAAVQARDDWTVSAPVDVTLGGYAGQRIDLELPANLTCENGGEYVVLADPSGDGWFRVGPSERIRLWILDVEGVPMTVFRSHSSSTADEVVTEADAIVDSVVITP